MLENKEIYHFFSKYIEDHIGVVFTEDIFFHLHNRLETVQLKFKIKNLQSLYMQAKIGLPEDMKCCLLDLATNNETSFFRDKKVFQAIKDIVLNRASDGKCHFDIWSAASSSGQESYSAAIMFEELIAEGKGVSYDILASDISGAILQKAKSAIYTQLDVQRGLSEELLYKYFIKESGKKWGVCPSIRNKVNFKQLNLVKPFFLDKQFDIILCRNVLIYQNQHRKEKILKKMSNHLMPGGYLILGTGEVLGHLRDQYDQSIINGAVIYQKKV